MIWVWLATAWSAIAGAAGLLIGAVVHEADQRAAGVLPARLSPRVGHRRGPTQRPLTRQEWLRIAAFVLGVAVLLAYVWWTRDRVWVRS